ISNLSVSLEIVASRANFPEPEPAGLPLPVEERGRTAGSGSGKFARLATIPGDTDRLEVRATFTASLQCYVLTSSRSAKIFQEREQPCPRDARIGEETRGQGCPRSFGCGSAALRLCVFALILVLTGEGVAVADDSLKLPPPANRPIDFVKDIKPIFAEHC